MKFLTFILHKIRPKDIPPPVGRWRIEHCHKQMNQKIDLSNEDHCGPCGQYALEKGKMQNGGQAIDIPPTQPTKV